MDNVLSRKATALLIHFGRLYSRPKRKPDSDFSPKWPTGRCSFGAFSIAVSHCGVNSKGGAFLPDLKVRVSSPKIPMNRTLDLLSYSGFILAVAVILYTMALA